MAKVFINFRNGDDPYAAALLFRALRQRFGADKVFRSSESIPAGARWADVIWANHRDSAVLIAVIGPRWLTVADRHGDAKLRDEADWVRVEIAAALAEKMLVIPVLLDGVPRLTRADLPDTLVALADLQTVSMSHRLIDVTIDVLVEQISPVIGPAHTRDETPATGQWLGVWNVPPRVPVAIDRAAPMAAVRADVLAARGVRPVVLHGGVGTGKTRLAIEYAHRFAGDYQCAWWVSAGRGALIATQLAALAGAAGFAPDHDIVAGLPALFDQLRRQGTFLLVFDGAEDPGVLAPYLRAVGAGGDIVITTRDADWGLLAAAPLRIGCFERPQSIEILASLRSGTTEPELDRLAAALDDLPIAVAQAGVFLAGAHIGVADYLDLLRTRARDLLNRGQTHLGVPPLAAAWSVGLERVTATAVELFELISVLATAPVPLAMLSSGAAALAPDLARCAADPIALDDLARAVVRSGLLRVEGHALHPYGLFQAFVRQGLDADRLAFLRASGRAALASMPRADPRVPAAWAEYDVLLPHAIALDLVAGDEPACQRLLLDVVHHLVVRADAGTARQLAAAALTRWRDRYGPDADVVLAMASRLAQALYRLGDYAGAEALDDEVLVRRRRCHGEDHPETLTAAHNLAMDRWARGADAAAARTLLDRVISGRRRTLGDDHPDTLRSMHNLAVMLRAIGQVEPAYDLDEDVYRRLRRALGDDHPDTLRSGYAVALDLRSLGRLSQARAIGRDTYQRARATFGADHPDALRSAYGYAVDLRSAGDLPGAHAVADDTYERRRRVLGEEHVDTLRAAYLLGLVRSEAGDPSGAELVEHAASRLARLAVSR